MYEKVKPGQILEATGRLLISFAGSSPAITEDFAVPFEKLVSGVCEIPVEIPWEEEYNDTRYTRRVIVLKKLNESMERIIFFNPSTRHDLPPGTPLGGEGMGPPRRIEEGGLESMELSLMVQYFAQGLAYAMLVE